MLKVLDLFSGIGGFSLGLESTGGFETVAFCEQDKHCQKVLKKHWPDKIIFDDVKKLYRVGQHLFDGPTEINTDIDVICGGFPCQDVSVANTKGKGLKGEKSNLWHEYKRLIKEVKPRWCIIENVANLRARGLATVLKNLNEIGYDCEWHIIPASAVGAPHRRERIWIIAHPNSDKLREQPGRCEWKDWKKETEFKNNDKVITNTVGPRLQRYIQERITILQRNEKRLTEFVDKKVLSFGEFKYWYSRALRKRDGVSNRVDRNRLKQLGNAVVPQIPKIIGEAILKYERRL